MKQINQNEQQMSIDKIFQKIIFDQVTLPQQQKKSFHLKNQENFLSSNTQITDEEIIKQININNQFDSQQEIQYIDEEMQDQVSPSLEDVSPSNQNNQQFPFLKLYLLIINHIFYENLRRKSNTQIALISPLLELKERNFSFIEEIESINQIQNIQMEIEQKTDNDSPVNLDLKLNKRCNSTIVDSNYYQNTIAKPGTNKFLKNETQSFISQESITPKQKSGIYKEFQNNITTKKYNFSKNFIQARDNTEMEIENSRIEHDADLKSQQIFKSDKWLQNDPILNDFLILKKIQQKKEIIFYKIMSKVDGIFYSLICIKRNLIMKTISNAEISKILLNLIEISKYDNPNIVKYYFSWQTCDSIFFVTEYCKYSIFQLINTKEYHFGEMQARSFLQDICSALKFLEEIKNENINLSLDSIFLSHNHKYKISLFNYESFIISSQIVKLHSINDLQQLGFLIHELITGQKFSLQDINKENNLIKLNSAVNISFSLKKLILKMILQGTNNWKLITYQEILNELGDDKIMITELLKEIKLKNKILKKKLQSLQNKLKLKRQKSI